MVARGSTFPSDYAFIVLCAALEHALVVAARQVGGDFSSSPAVALKTLFAYGVVDDETYVNVETVLKLRNDIVHGRQSDVDAQSWVTAIPPIVEELLSAA